MAGPVVLWLQQAFRLHDNDALDTALTEAERHGSPLVVLHGLADDHPLASPRVNRFLMESALETLAALEKRGATARHLDATRSSPLADQVVAYALETKASVIVADDPLTYMPKGNLRRAERLLADADTGLALTRTEPNLVVPSVLYGKAAVGAYAIRKTLQQESQPRLSRPVARVPARIGGGDAPDPPGRAPGDCAPERHDSGAPFQKPSPLARMPGGEKAARRRLLAAMRGRLDEYGERGEARDGGHHTRLSQDLHFGLLSPREVARAALKSGAEGARVNNFLEQLIVRRELSFNAARYLPTLRSLDVLPDWAKRTLAAHDGDRREHVYTEAEFAAGETHDEVWNATQRELRECGTIHSYMRMYWGKKIMEWSASHEDARAVMERLNGAWALDGRGAPMWANHLWCFGLHDRAFQERPVFGKVRWMSAEGTKKKFDVPAYIEWTEAGCPPL